MKKVLWVGDAGCPSGFARVTHEILNVVQETYVPSVLGINYRGDPHEYTYPIWAAAIGGDFMGVKRLVWMCDAVKPDVIVLLNDGWNIRSYLQQLRIKKSDGTYAWPEYAAIPVIAIVAVDGKNFDGTWLDGVAHTVFWTQFALDEAREGGFTGTASVIPLGVDLDTYKPMDRVEALRIKHIDGELTGKFIVGNVNRNQPRKRWDLTIRYFAEWVYHGKPRTLRTGQNMAIKDAFLYAHIAPTGDNHVHIRELCTYYGILERLILSEPQIWYGADERDMAIAYNCFDVALTTTQGEGFGLPTLEAMACGVPVIVPTWSALGDWPKGASFQVPCTSTAIGMPYVNVIGGVVDEQACIKALNFLYQNRDVRKQNARAALERARQEQFRWRNIGERFTEVLDFVTAAKEEPVGAQV